MTPASTIVRPLDSMETALTLMEQFAPMAAVCVVQLTQAPAAAALVAGLAKVQAKQPLLRSQIVKEGGRFKFALLKDPPTIPFVSEPRQGKEHWRDVVTQALNSHIDLAKPPYLKCIYLEDQAREEADLVLVFHHAIMDAYSGLQLLHQLLALCVEPNKDLGEPYPFPGPIDQRMPDDLQGWRGRQRLASFMAQQMRDELAYRRGLRDARRQTIHPTANCLILTRELDSETTRAIIRRSLAERLTTNSVICAALLLAVHRCLYDSEPTQLRSLTFSNLRPYLSPTIPDDLLACEIAMLRQTIAVSQRPDLMRTAHALQEQLYAISKGGDKFLFAQTSKSLVQMSSRFEVMRMGTTAVSFVGSIALASRYGNIGVTGLHAFISNNRVGPEYSAFAKVMNGSLSWDFLYLDSDMDEEMAEKVADATCKLLREAVS